MRDTESGFTVMSRLEAAQFLGIGVGLLDRSPVPYSRIGKRKLYNRSTVIDWLEKQGQVPGPDRKKNLKGAYVGQ